MTEEEAKAWLRARDVSRETFARLEQFVAFLRYENANQNLIAASTMEAIWSRHFVDSAQLLGLAPTSGSWLDLGSGAGFPGLIVAMVGERPVTLVESRAKRVGFLRAAAAQSGLEASVNVFGARLETMEARPFDIISARAFAPLGRLLALAHCFSRPSTLWLLPKGRGAADELAEATTSWQGTFRIVPSVTDPDSAIIVASNVRPRKQR